MERCIEACRDCHSSCVETIAHCLQKGGEHAEVGHITLMQDCADICELSEEVMLRSRRRFVNRVCALCADDAAMPAPKLRDGSMTRPCKRCAEQCHSCAGACREMLTGGEIRNRLTRSRDHSVMTWVARNLLSANSREK